MSFKNAECFKRIPKHIGIIPDGNRRWALSNHLEKKDGYEHGVKPGFTLYEQLLDYGVKEATFYGFTKDNTTRPSEQTSAYTKACVDAVESLTNKDANLLVIGNTDSKMFPEELKKYANHRVTFGKGLINLNFLVNYDWQWDVNQAASITDTSHTSKDFAKNIASKDIPRVDLIIRWGGHTRLSGFLPIQSVYSDFYVIKDYWPDFKKSHLAEALNWYQNCDVTLGG
jgi:undecaprenyl diphosphate synthase